MSGFNYWSFVKVYCEYVQSPQMDDNGPEMYLVHVSISHTALHGLRGHGGSSINIVRCG